MAARPRSVAARLLRLWVRIPPGGMDICLLSVLCIVSWRSLRRADQSSRGVLPTEVRRCVGSGNLLNEETVVGVGPRRYRGEKYRIIKRFMLYHLLYNLQLKPSC